MARTDTSEGQALWQPEGAEEDSRLCEGNRHLHLAYDEEEEEAPVSVALEADVFPPWPSKTYKLIQQHYRL